MSYQNIKNYRTRLKDRAVYVMGDKCQCCGYNKTNSALEFHHLDPSQKDFSISTNSNRSWKSVRNELQKCVLVCANCHREIHCNIIDTTDLKSSLNEERALQIDSLLEQVKLKQIFYCSECGCEVSRGNNLCPKCAAIKKRIVHRPNRTELKHLIREHSFVQIGKMFGVSDNTIRKWCLSENLPSRVSDIKQYTNEQWELI